MFLQGNVYNCFTRGKHSHDLEHLSVAVPKCRSYDEPFSLSASGFWRSKQATSLRQFP